MLKKLIADSQKTSRIRVVNKNPIILANESLGCIQSVNPCTIMSNVLRQMEFFSPSSLAEMQ